MTDSFKQITPPEALQALKRSGYLLESRLENVLQANLFRVDANVLIPDDLTGKPREIDLLASWAYGLTIGSTDDHSLSTELVIECVNPGQPVAFITKQRPDSFFEKTDVWDALKIVGNPPEPMTSPHDMWSWLPSSLDVKRYHHYRTPRIATQYCSFTRKGGSTEWMAQHREDDHQSIRKLCAATDHVIRDVIVPNYVQDGAWSLFLVYPVLVLQSPLYEVKPSSRSARIIRSDHLQYRCRHAVRGEEHEYQIDVVTERYFPKYLALVIGELQRMARRMRKDHRNLQEFRALRMENLRRYHSLNDNPSEERSN